MAINFDALYRQAQADLAEQDSTARKSATPVLDTLMQAWGTGIEQREYNIKAKYYKDRELDGLGSSLDDLIAVIDNSDSLSTAEAQLAVYERKAGSDAEHRVKAMTLREGMGKKSEAMTNYNLAIEEASNAFDKGEMSFKQADYENLPTTYEAINAQRKADGLKPHGSIMDYMKSELDRTQRLMTGILPGMKKNELGAFETAFRYGKANNSDISTFNKLSKHAENLDIAMKALVGDGLITPEEAKAMMISPEYYEETKKGAAAESKDQLGIGQTNYNWWRNAINKVKQGEFVFDENDVMMQNIVGADIEKLKSGKLEDQLEVMNEQRDVYLGDMKFQDDKHFRWTGRHLIERADKPDPGYFSQFDPADPEVTTDIPIDEQVSEEAESLQPVSEPKPEPSPYPELDPSKEAENVKSYAVKQVGKQAEKVNQSINVIDDYKYDSGRGRVVGKVNTDGVAYEIPKNRKSKSLLEKHLNLDAGTPIGLEQLKEVKTEYDSDMVTLNTVNDKIEGIVDFAKDYPEGKYTAGGRDPRKWDGWKELKELENQMKKITSKWRVTKEGDPYGTTFSVSLIQQLNTGLERYELSKQDYEKELAQLEKIKKSAKK